MLRLKVIFWSAHCKGSHFYRMFFPLLLTVVLCFQRAVGITCDESTPEMCVCQDGWKLIGTQCYLLSTEAIKYEDAEASCQAKDAQLVEIYDAIEEAAMLDLVKEETPEEAVYIGLTDRDVEGTFTWNSGAPLVYTAWRESRQPDNYQNNEDCTIIIYRQSDTDGWNDIPCGGRKRYICERKADIVCPDDGWVLIGDQCYFLSTEAIKYEEAEFACQSKNAQLVEIHDGIEEAAMLDLVKKEAPEEAVYIGLTDRDVEGTFTWNSGAPLVYTAWRESRQPDNYQNNEDCTIIIYRQSGTDGWNDIPCGARKRYICE